MQNNSKKLLLVTTIVTLLPILAGVLLWKELPDRMATNFSMSGAANGYSSKWFAVFGIPAFCAGCHLLCVVGMAQDPKSQKYPSRLRKLTAWICPVVSWFCAAAIYGNALGLKSDFTAQAILLFIGILFLVIGNYLPKVKQNYYLGIKLPWTLADEENWNKTHRMAGKCWVIGGILLTANSFVITRFPWITWIVLALLVVAPSVYSYLYSRKKK